MPRKLLVELRTLSLFVTVDDVRIGALEKLEVRATGDIRDVIATFPAIKCSDDTEARIVEYTKLLAEAWVRVFRGGKQIAGPADTLRLGA